MTKRHKLVRSRVIEILKSKNLPFSSYTAEPDEYEKMLLAKLQEEALEVLTAPANSMRKEELADLLEVVEAIKTLFGYSTEEIEDIRLKKLAEKGDFKSAIILEES